MLREKKSFIEKIKSFDLILITIVFLIGLVSCFTMYSTDGGQFGYHTSSHIYRLSIFFIFFLTFSFVRISFWHNYSYVIYLIFLILLVGVKFFGITASGSQRWINLYFINLQPSELMKIGMIMFLARYYHRISSEDVNRVKYLIQPIIVILIPFFLVIDQPDLGTAILIASGGIVIIWLAGLGLKYFIYSTIIFLTSLPVVIAFLKPYQKMRILTFFNPDLDPLGAGYQIIQSKIAIGSGGFLGKGFLKGTQSYLDYLPEKHTDFIFTLFSEEFGFLGSSILLLLYFILITRIIMIGYKAQSHFAKLYCFGFATAFFIYVAVNMSMVLGLLPIVGSPLPIMSYGGSAMLATMLGLGIVMSSKIYNDEQIS